MILTALLVIAAATCLMALETVVFAVQRFRKRRSERKETLALAEQIRQARAAAELAAAGADTPTSDAAGGSR